MKSIHRIGRSAIKKNKIDLHVLACEDVKDILLRKASCQTMYFHIVCVSVFLLSTYLCITYIFKALCVYVCVCMTICT